MKFRTPFTFGLAILLTTACLPTKKSSEVDQNRIDQIYSVELFDRGGKNISTSITANFHAGIAHVVLIPPAEVRHQGNRMEGGVSWDRVYTSPSDKRELHHQFAFSDNDGKQFYNSISLRPIALPAGIEREIPSKKNLRVIWEGEPLGDDEQVTLTVETGNGYFVYSLVDKLGTREVEISSEKLATLTPGPVQVKIRRDRVSRLQQPTKYGTGNLTGKYHFERDTFRLVP